MESGASLPLDDINASCPWRSATSLQDPARAALNFHKLDVDNQCSRFHDHHFNADEKRRFGYVDNFIAVLYVFTQRLVYISMQLPTTRAVALKLEISCSFLPA